MAQTASKLLGEVETAATIGIPVRVLRNLRNQRKIPCYKVTGQRIFYILEDVLAALKQNQEDQ
jgi:hypothetical protein